MPDLSTMLQINAALQQPSGAGADAPASPPASVPVAASSAPQIAPSAPQAPASAPAQQQVAPVIDVGGSPNAAPGAPGSQLAPVAAAPSSVGSAQAPSATAPASSPPSSGVSPQVDGVLAQLRAGQSGGAPPAQTPPPAPASPQAAVPPAQTAPSAAPPAAGAPSPASASASAPAAAFGHQWNDPGLADKMAAIEHTLNNPHLPVNSTPAATGGARQQQQPSNQPPRGGYTTVGGIISNIGAGTSEGVAQFLGTPVDLATGAMNAVPEAINAVTGSKIPTIQNPVGGSHFWEKAEGLIDADPENVQPANGFEAGLRTAADGATSVALPGTLARMMPEMAAGAAENARRMYAGGGSVGGAVAGGAGAVAGQQAADAVPEPYKPLANLAGNIAGGGLAVGVGAGAQAAGRVASDAVGRVTAPISMGAKETFVDPRTGQPIADAQGNPLTGTPAQIKLAAKKVAMAAGQSPEELAASIPAGNGANGVPGVTNTMGQVLGNKTLLGLERQLRNTPDGRAAFLNAEGANNTARVAEVQSLAPADAGPKAGRFVQQQLSALQTRAAQVEAQGSQRVQAANTAAGVTGARADVAAMGADQQAALEAARKPVKEAASALYQAIDPDGKLALDASSVGNAADDIKSKIGLGGSIDPAEQNVLDAAQTLDGVVPFSSLRELSGNVAAALRSIRRNPQLGAESQPYARMSQLMGSIHGAISKAASDQAESDAAAVQAGTKAPENTIQARLQNIADTSAPSTGDTVFTPSGRQVGVRYRVVEGGDLTASHDQDLQPNPAYPAELQPRDRSRAASQVQVQKMAGSLQPERLGASNSAMEGAPIVGPDGVVESGNARTLAIQRAHDEGGRSSSDYRDWLTSQGYDVSGMKSPILVRERTSDLSPEDRQRFTQEANASPGLAMGASERAAVDAGRIPHDALDQLQDGDVTSAANRNFVRSFIRNVPEQGEDAGFYTHDGELSMEGAQRIRNALLHRAYGDSGLVSSLTETGDDGIRSFGGALSDAAGGMAKLKAGIEKGDVTPSVDLAPHLVDAARLISQARAKGISVRDMVGQQDMLSGGASPLTQDILKAAYGENLTGRVARAKLSDLLAFYADEATKQSTLPRLFGENASPSEILAQGIARDKTRSPGQAGSAGNAIGVRQSVGSDGNQARGFGNGAQGSGNGAPRSIGATALEHPPLISEALKPNFPPQTAADLRTANAAYADYKQKFRQGPVGDVLQSAPTASGFKLPEAQVPAKLFAPGAKGATAADSLIAATGSVDAAQRVLGDYPAFSFRAAALKPDGSLNTAKADAWIANHQQALQRFPDLANGFRNAAEAQRTADAAAARAQDTLDRYQDSAVGKYLHRNGDSVDPQVAINKFMSDDNPAAAVRQFLQTANGNQAATDGLRRNMIDWLMAKTRGTMEAGTTGQKEMASGMFQRTIATPKVLRAFEAAFPPADVKRLLTVGQNLEDAARAWNAVKIPGSPTTAADLHALQGHEGGASLLIQAEIASRFGDAAAGAVAAKAGGIMGTFLGAGGAVGVMLLNAARAAGYGKVNQIATQMVLNPEFGRAMLQKGVTNPRAPIVQKAIRQIMALAPGAAAQSQQQ